MALRKLARYTLAISGLTAGSFFLLGYKPTRTATPFSVKVHASTWHKHHTKDDTYQITTNTTTQNKDLLVEAVRAYFSSFTFLPQAFLMGRGRKEANAALEQWDMAKLSRKDLEPGKFLFDHFQILEVGENILWLKMDMGVIAVEVLKKKKSEEGQGGKEGQGEGGREDVTVSMSTIFFQPIPAPLFYPHLLYQRVLMQGAGRLMAK